MGNLDSGSLYSAIKEQQFDHMWKISYKYMMSIGLSMCMYRHINKNEKNDSARANFSWASSYQTKCNFACHQWVSLLLGVRSQSYPFMLSTFVFLELLGIMSFSAPHGYTTIAAGTVVSVYALNGHALLSWECGMGQDIEWVSRVMCGVIGKRLRVPLQSLHLVWGPVLDEPCQAMAPSYSPAIGGGLTVGVVYAISHIERVLLFGEACQCHICGDPCEKAIPVMGAWPMGPGIRTVQMNCFLCSPSHLCTNCHIQLADGGWRCFRCLEEFDGLDIAMTTLKRFELVSPDRFHELRAIFHWKKLFCNKDRLRRRILWVPSHRR